MLKLNSLRVLRRGGAGERTLMLLCPLSRAPLVATKGNGLLLHFYKKQRLGNWDAEHSEEWKDLQIPS